MPTVRWVQGEAPGAPQLHQMRIELLARNVREYRTKPVKEHVVSFPLFLVKPSKGCFETSIKILNGVAGDPHRISREVRPRQYWCQDCRRICKHCVLEQEKENFGRFSR